MRLFSLRIERGWSEEHLSQERAKEALAIIRKTRDRLGLEGRPLLKSFAQAALLVAARSVRLERTAARTPNGEVARSLERDEGIKVKF